MNTYDQNTKGIVYLCGTDQRTSLVAIFAKELNLAETITGLV